MPYNNPACIRRHALRHFLWGCTISAKIALLVSSPTFADEGKPVAVRWWGQAMVSIETYWNLQVVIDPFPPNIGYTDPQLTADLVLITHEHPDHNHAQLVGGEPVVVHGLENQRQVRAVSHVLDRMPNEEKPTWQSMDEDLNARKSKSGHEITVKTVAAWHDDEQGGDRGANAIFVVDVDGLRIVHCGDFGQTKLTDEQLAALGRVDVLLIPVGGIFTVDGPQAVEIIAQIRPRYAVPLHFKTPALTFDLHGIEPFMDAVGDRWKIDRSGHNTLAVAHVKADSESTTRVVQLAYEPWQPAGELADLLAGMERACRESQEVFQPLSTEQMNFRPSDGTHTPRWNAEHMMAAPLRFFTQIYSQREPAVAPINLSPAQMPPDYKSAHPEWTGAEEARQMERAVALVLRFAYLLDGIALDEPAPGSRWTPRRLLEQMARHFHEHTANVKKKFSLPDWPKE
jgi:L-ascorbate metabolism protein UlaG (beta-lactamase superfamily)